jgi:L-amino acid N-acyltransferase YncA
VSAPPHATVRRAAMTTEHGLEVLAIYQAGIDAGDATFETSARTPSRLVPWQAMFASLAA